MRGWSQRQRAILLALVSGVLAWQVTSAKPAAGSGIAIDDVKGIYMSGTLTKYDLDGLKRLKGGLARLYDVQLKEVKAEDKNTDAPIFVLGKEAAIESGLITIRELAAVSPGGFVVRTTKNRVAIAGKTVHWTNQGVMFYLEELGLHSYFNRFRHATLKVVKPTSRELPALQMDRKPVMPFRFGDTRIELGDAKQVMQRAGQIPPIFSIAHTAYYLVPMPLFYDEHPEYYAMLSDGKRIARDAVDGFRTTLCLSNKDVHEISVDRALRWVELTPDKTYYDINYGDTGTHCQCENCLALDPEPGEYATRMLHWVNPVAKAMKEHYPDKIAFYYAYAGTIDPPEKAEFVDNTWVVFCGGLKSICFDHIMAKPSKQFKKRMAYFDAWLKLSEGRMIIGEYGSPYRPSMVDDLASRMRYYAERGCEGIYQFWGTPPNFSDIFYYLYPRLCWDPNVDAQALAQEFCLARYGAAGRPLADYLKLCHERYQETLKAGSEMKRGAPEGWYSPTFTAAAMACFERARAGLMKTKPEDGTSKEAKLKMREWKRLFSKVIHEKNQFVLSWMQYPPEETLTDAAKTLLSSQLDALAMGSEVFSDREKMTFARDVHAKGLATERVLKGALKFFEGWIAAQNFPMPGVQRTGNSIRVPANAFMYGFYQHNYVGGHVGPPCPARPTNFLYVEGNNMKRSSRMQVTFTLDEVPNDGAARVDLWGQDCDHKTDTAEMAVEVNGVEVYKGQVGFVKWNWSQMSFDIPAGILKKGENLVSVSNAGDPKSIKKWHDRWLGISDTEIRFTK